MSNIIFIVLGLCQPTVIQGFTTPWTVVDVAVVSRASKVCKSQYNMCVKSVVKKDSETYRVQCGGTSDPIKTSNQVKED